MKTLIHNLIAATCIIILSSLQSTPAFAKKSSVLEELDQGLPASEKKRLESVRAKGKKSGVKDELLVSVEKKYSKAKSVQMKVKKELELPLLKKKRTFDGDLVIKPKGKFKFELLTPSQSAVIVDGQRVWIVEYPADPEFDKTIRIISSKDPTKMQSPVLVTFLMGKGSLLDHFKIEKKSAAGATTSYQLKPKDTEGDVKFLKLNLNTENHLIESIEFTDQLDNISRFQFTEVEFDKKVSDKIFEYSPPKGAEITEM